MNIPSESKKRAVEQKRQAKKSKKRQNEYVEYMRTELNIKYLSQKYRKAHEWLPRLEIEAPNLTSEQALKKVRDRLSELKALRKRYKKSRLLQHQEKAREKGDPQRGTPVRAIPQRERFFFCGWSDLERPEKCCVPHPLHR